MKFSLEYTKEEYTALIDMVNKMTGVVEIALKHRHEEQMARILTQRMKTVGQMFDEMDDDIDEDLEETILNVVKGGKPDLGPFAPKEEDSVEIIEPDSPDGMTGFAQRGQKVFNDLVALWMQGFNQEGVEQPPRAEECQKLTQSFDGRAIIHYMEYIKGRYRDGGLTYAIRDSGLVPNDTVRLLAENMTAVSSACRFTQLASYLEHPDPSQLEDFFNV